jgi:site-specific DNA recombinase
MIYVGKVDYGGQVYNGEQERIVDDETWNRVQTALNRNGRCGGRNIGNKYGALLKGLVRCGSCDVGMIHTYVSKKNHLYRYYVCVKAHQRGWAQCETRSVSAPRLKTLWSSSFGASGRIQRCCTKCCGNLIITGGALQRR